MKRLNNILSYLWGLLLVLMLTTCSDWEEIVVTMQGEEEVELTIQTNIPSLGGGATRTAPTEDITSITALAFDSDHELIKVVIINDVSIEPSATPSTSGTYKVKVPVRTRRIHFIAKNDDNPNDETDVEFTEITDVDYGMSDEELLKDRLATELHYWGMLDFIDAAALKSGGDVTLYRNMAKVTLETDGENDYIAGFLNYNVKGTIVPYKDGVLGYQTDTNHDLPTNFDITSDEEERNLGKAHYVFEEFNDTINNNTDLVYAICNIDSIYYKIAFKSSTDYYYLIRNQVYNIKIVGALDEGLGKGTYAEAVQNGKPINDTTKEKVYISFIPDEETTFFIGTTDEGSTRVSMYLGDTGKIKVKIPEGITELQIGYSTINFDAGGVTTTTVTKIGDTETKGNVYVDTYDLTNLGDAREIELSMTLKGSIKDAIDGLEIQFRGVEGEKQSDDKLVVDVVKQANLTVNPTTVSLPKAAGSEFAVTVTIPDYVQGDLSLHIGDIDAKYTITPPDGLVLEKGMYHVTKGMRYTFYFTLNEDGSIGDKHTINFDLYSRFFHLTGATSVTLIDDAVPDQDTYEIWVGDGNAWTGTTNSVEFFGYETTAESNGFDKVTTLPTGFRTDFYDTGANSHKSQAMLMGSDDSFTFTIPEGDNRWLTLLVANDDNDDTPSIQLSNGSDWVTVSSNDGVVPANYNFGNGEITTAGRLIRYELEPGTYTLQGSSAEYLLYYMRVTKDKPTMTDVATDATTSNYTLAWSGGEWGNYTKINDTYFVDDDAKTFTPTLTYKGLTGVKLAASSSLNITTGKYSFSDNQGDGTTITYEEAKSNSNGSNNGDIAITGDYNAGTYALNGIANVTETEYKYAAFYDVLRLNTVGFTVKNTIKLGLYYSWNGDAKTITEYVDGLPYIIGFRMPYSLPVAINAENDTSTPINFTIDSKWERRESGLGVICNAPNYQLASQQEGNSSNNRVHPRPEWTYKIEWYEVVESTIQPTTADTDIYFSYGKDNSGNAYITKEPVIATTKSASEKLALTLDFSSNSENGSTHTLNFGDNFYLRATISAEDANKYAGAHVRFTGSFGQDAGNSAIDWANSRKDGSIEYARNSSDGTQLQFKVEAGKTEYEIRWQFVRNDDSTTPTQFTYTVDNDAYNITNGSESATIVLNGNGQVVDNPLDLNLDFYALDANSQKVEKGVNGSYTDLLLGTSRFVLEVTIDDADLQNYSGQPVYLAGDFETTALGAAENGWAIRWDQSKTNGAINYYGQNNNGSGLQFQINGSKTYKIEWVFKTGGNYKGGVIGFDYKISAHSDSPTKYNLSGDTQATIAFTNEPTNAEPDNTGGTTIWTGSQQWGDWSAGDYQPNYLAIDYFLPQGTEITLNVTSANGGAIEMHDCTLTSLRLEPSDVSYPAEGDDYFNVEIGNTSPKFTVPSGGGVNGLRINGSNVTITSVVVKYPNVTGEIFSRDFNDNNAINGWGGDGYIAPTAPEGYLVLTNNNGGFAQAAVDMGYVPGSYTLSYRIKGSVNGSIKQNFQHYYSPKNADGSAGNDVYDEDINNPKDQSTQFTTEWSDVIKIDITISKGANRLLFDYSNFTGTINIDDLKLVKNN